MRSLKNMVKVAVIDRQDQTNVAGTVELREGIFLSGMRLLGSALGIGTSGVLIGPATIQGAPAITSMPKALLRSAMRHWHPGHRYSVSCFACSS